MQRRGFLRNFIFGAEDSLVSTVGLLSGVCFAGLSSRNIIVSGVILIFVEALSMGAGVYVSEDSANEITDGNHRDNQLSDAIVMFVSYLLIGLIPLLPYVFISNTRIGFYYSIGFTIVSLFFLGMFKGYYVKNHILKSALKITIIGAAVTLISVAVGLLFN